MGRNRTDLLCTVNRLIAHVPGRRRTVCPLTPHGRPARMPAVLQTTTDTSQQNNTGPLGGQ